MARLQILELPEGTDDDRPPFVLVVDQADEATVESLNRQAAIPGQPMAYHPVAQQVGARAILLFEETVDIPVNETPVDPDGYPLKFRVEPDFETFREQVQDEIRKTQADLARAINGDPSVDAHAELTRSENARDQLRSDRDEARMWARHGYEIGQRHCSWSDYGVAPDWLTEGWPRSFDSCEHLQKAAEYDEALARVRGLHRPVEHHGRTICAECSGYGGQSTDNAPVDHDKCGTLLALNGDTERGPEE